MQTTFEQDFPKFQAKIAQFRHNTNFETRMAEYVELMNQMMSVSPDDMREYAERSPKFLDARNHSLAIMERILEIHQNLDEIFKMDATALQRYCEGDLGKIDQEIAKSVKESAVLLKQYEQWSEEGRKALEVLNSPFLSQGL